MTCPAVAEPRPLEFGDWERAAPPYTLPAAEVMTELHAVRGGLTEREAAIRASTFGPNELPHVPPPTLLQIVLRQFTSPLIYILAIAAGVALALGEGKDAAFIAGVLIINAIIGTIQESHAEKASQALQKLLTIRATVRRDGETRMMDAVALVPGDVVWLESGNRVPADLRLLISHGLEMDESLLTGESTTVTKEAAWTGPPETPLADRRNMVHAGSIVVHGRCEGVVAATGAASEVGRLALDVMGSQGGRPPLVERMEEFTRRIAVAVLLAAAIVSVVGVTLGGYSVVEMFLFGVALAVSAIPEGLPVALTVALAIGTTRMAKRGVIVRQLAAVEGLGSCTLIASDKTGTLTCNALTVRELRLPDGSVYEVTGEGFVPEGDVLLDGRPLEPDGAARLADLARACVLCNEADLYTHDHTGWNWRGDPTDVALLVMSHKLGWKRQLSLDLHPQVNEIPFEPERQYAATYHRIDGGIRAMVKGAPERVLGMCDGDRRAVDELRSAAETMARAGYRVLAVAEGAAPEGIDESVNPPDPTGLSCLGLVGMIDPLRAGVREAVADARGAGVQTIMVTGDHPVTALAIARDLGLAERPEEVVTGPDMAAMSAGELGAIMSRVRVFARVAPHQKLEIVEAAKAAGHYVAVTGDGVNDAPALKAANIGVAMGQAGTDVAREAAELVISDDHFATITAGIEEGRIAYNNIRNVIYLLISTGAAEVVLVALAIASGHPLPLLPVQLLWLNLVTNGIQDVALAFEPGVGDIRHQPPRPPGEPIFNRLMIERTVIGALVMGIVAFWLFDYLLGHGYTEHAARNSVLLLMVLFENVHIFNCRSETVSAFRLSIFRSPVLMIGIVCAFSVHVAMLYLPFGQALLETEAVSLDHWAMLVTLSLSILVVMELHKLWWNRRYGGSAPRAALTTSA
jgi:magnesium-transporting ATPase (P-type)